MHALTFVKLTNVFFIYKEIIQKKIKYRKNI
jgi:hypothetical protein